MEQELYTIYDKLAESSGTPFTQPNEAVAIRSLLSLLQDRPPFDHENYQLFKLGSYNPRTMEHKLHTPIEIQFQG